MEEKDASGLHSKWLSIEESLNAPCCGDGLKEMFVAPCRDILCEECIERCTEPSTQAVVCPFCRTSGPRAGFVPIQPLSAIAQVFRGCPELKMMIRRSLDTAEHQIAPGDNPSSVPIPNGGLRPLPGPVGGGGGRAFNPPPFAPEPPHPRPIHSMGGGAGGMGGTDQHSQYPPTGPSGYPNPIRLPDGSVHHSAPPPMAHGNDPRLPHPQQRGATLHYPPSPSAGGNANYQPLMPVHPNGNAGMATAPPSAPWTHAPTPQTYHPHQQRQQLQQAFPPPPRPMPTAGRGEGPYLQQQQQSQFGGGYSGIMEGGGHRGVGGPAPAAAPLLSGGGRTLNVPTGHGHSQGGNGMGAGPLPGNAWSSQHPHTHAQAMAQGQAPSHLRPAPFPDYPAPSPGGISPSHAGGNHPVAAVASSIYPHPYPAPPPYAAFPHQTDSDTQRIGGGMGGHSRQLVGSSTTVSHLQQQQRMQQQQQQPPNDVRTAGRQTREKDQEKEREKEQRQQPDVMDSGAFVRGPSGSNLFVCSMPDWAVERDMVEWASEYGRVLGCRLIRHANGRSRNLAHLATASPQDALKVIRGLRGKVMTMDPSDPRYTPQRPPKARTIVVDPRRAEMADMLAALAPEDAVEVAQLVCMKKEPVKEEEQADGNDSDPQHEEEAGD